MRSQVNCNNLLDGDGDGEGEGGCGGLKARRRKGLNGRLGSLKSYKTVTLPDL